jgi:hypothetical protein
VDVAAFIVAVLATFLVGMLTFLMQARQGMALHEVVNTTLWGVLLGMLAYVLYGLGWLPGATDLQRLYRPWGAGGVTFLASLLPFVVMRVRTMLIRLGASQLEDEEREA